MIVSNLIVSRFGGNAALNSNEVKKSAEIIRSNPDRRYVIVSAPGPSPNALGITDLLYICHSGFSNHENCDEMLAKISERYSEIVSGLGIDFDVGAEMSALRKSLEFGMNLDYIGSRGEYIMAKIFAKFLDWPFVDAQEILFFNKEGTPDKTKTFKIAGEVLKDYDRAVIPSFYGSLPDGKIKTFRRGDCDTAGAMVACSVKADIFEKWSEDAKIFSADPSVIPDAELIQNITYNEALELNYMGMDLVTDDVVFMLQEAGIPMMISGIHVSNDEAMMISPKLPHNAMRDVVSCIAGRKNFNVIHIQKYGMNKIYDFGGKLFGLFAKHHIACQHYLSGIHQMSVVLKTPMFELRREEIISEIKREIAPDSITVEKGLSLIAIIGEGMGTVKGIFSKILNALSMAEIKVQMIEQGSDKLNMILGVYDRDYEDAVKALYKAVILNEAII
ncbi:MAG: hypothetical protein IJL11_02260 [Synergistaceae bacterium]|nr:hypothetical protein [Synergistaceae bacterium]